MRLATEAESQAIGCETIDDKNCTETFEPHSKFKCLVKILVQMLMHSGWHERFPIFGLYVSYSQKKCRY